MVCDEGRQQLARGSPRGVEVPSGRCQDRRRCILQCTCLQCGSEAGDAALLE